MISIRSGRGIGDNLYLQSIVRHLVERGENLEVCTDWPDIFRPIADKVTFSPHRRQNIDRLSHYTTRKNIAETDQFKDCCITAGIKERVDLRLDWTVTNPNLVASMPGRRPVVLVQLPREPFGRSDGYGMALLPNCGTLQRAIDMIGDRATIVQVGRGAPLYRFRGIDLDLTDKTSVAELIDCGFVADGVLGYCSFFVPLAETFAKPALFVWSSRGLRSGVEYLRTITPQKILHRASSRFVIDDCSTQELAGAVDAFLEQAGTAALVRGQAGRDCRQRAGGAG